MWKSSCGGVGGVRWAPSVWSVGAWEKPVLLSAAEPTPAVPEQHSSCPPAFQRRYWPWSPPLGPLRWRSREQRTWTQRRRDRPNRSTRIDELTWEKCTAAALGRALFPTRPESSSRSPTRHWRRKTGSGSELGSAPDRWGRCSDWTPPGCRLQTQRRTSWKSKHNRFCRASGNKAPFIKLKKGDFHSRHTHTEEFCPLCCPSKGW